MKAYTITSPYNGKITCIDKPKLERGWVLIKVAHAGVCGTDVHIFRGEMSVSLPLVPGHEFSGIVEEKGEYIVGPVSYTHLTLPTILLV